jgi:RNA polymerase sigma-70 factor, ECF subfamily
VEAVTAEQWPSRGLDQVHERLRAADAVSRRRRFEALLERHESRLRRVAFGLIGDANRVDDVLQDALLKAYRSLPAHFESAGHEAAWLYRIVQRTCLNELRSRRRRPELPGVPETAARATDEAAHASLAVAAALAELPVDARAVVLLVDLIGLDYATAAGALEIPRGTVASRLNAARTLLRAAFIALEGGGDDRGA